MSEPTKAAQRAVGIVSEYCLSGRFSEMAEIIDRETGLPELVAALRSAMYMLKNLRHDYPDDEAEKINRVLGDIEFALRKSGAL